MHFHTTKRTPRCGLCCATVTFRGGHHPHPGGLDTCYSPEKATHESSHSSSPLRPSPQVVHWRDQLLQRSASHRRTRPTALPVTLMHWRLILPSDPLRVQSLVSASHRAGERTRQCHVRFCFGLANYVGHLATGLSFMPESSSWLPKTATHLS
ncbi:hypothetical protein PAXRUDRAFT_271196 [Paxillus rubicundulus Ve08.2h10]|uniref:Uncharacterized protein n=1 Tax=Paxillus rubicundulus Ve08.2h10 TaxID=930991 RepID=A0A0D0EAH8_9AGAM|nr:hypothetical protein PAXRUDRAFT_271196 [Paxillus rubicundulus Ve08.2h10]